LLVDVREGGEQAILEIGVLEQGGIDHQEGHRVQPGERLFRVLALGPGLGLGLDGGDFVKFFPLFPLLRVGDDLREQTGGNPVEGEAPVALGDELLFLKEGFLEILKLGKERAAVFFPLKC